LNHFPAVNLFQVRAPGPGYWRLTALDRFNGTVWTASTQRRTLSLGREVRRSSLAPVVDRVEQRIRIENLAGPWVPGEFEAVWVRGIKGVGLEPVTRTLVTSRGFRTGDEFSVISDVAVPSGDDLEQDDGPDPAGDQYLALPGTTPPIVRNVALFVTARAGTKLEKAIALQDYLRTFDYDLNVALHHSYSDLVRFLTDVRAGYCEQFAAAMAVMARSIGIPARVAIGFGSGDLASSNTYEVTSQHAHAWVEIHFPTYGWMAFEPTPRTDGFDVPRYARFAPGAAQPTAAPSVTPPTTTPTPTPSGEARAERPDAGTPSATGSSARGWLLVPIAAAVLLALLTAALPVPATTRRVLRRRRARTPPQVVGVRYVEFLEWCRAAALGRHPSETPVEHARRLAARPSVAARPLDDLAALATAAVYAGDGNAIEPGAVAARAAAARKAVAPSVSRARRILPVIGWGWWNAEDAARNKRRR
jgi:transglutaminase-like putative cysteine protease